MRRNSMYMVINTPEFHFTPEVLFIYDAGLGGISGAGAVALLPVC